jgi:osmotically-inducible protein OsmY
MLGRNHKSDKDISTLVDQKLSRTGASSQARITAMVRQGTVTLTGNLQYAAQRSPIVKSVSSIAGVRRVVDLLQLVERKRT